MNSLFFPGLKAGGNKRAVLSLGLLMPNIEAEAGEMTGKERDSS
jgi:hypothetical protein